MIKKLLTVLHLLKIFLLVLLSTCIIIKNVFSMVKMTMEVLILRITPQSQPQEGHRIPIWRIPKMITWLHPQRKRRN